MEAFRENLSIVPYVHQRELGSAQRP
jgi:hypothetical protein